MSTLRDFIRAVPGRAAILLSAAAVSALSFSSPAFAQVVDGPPCPDVMVIAARGSGEEPKADFANPAHYTAENTEFGVGSVNYEFYKKLDETSRLTFRLNPVKYPADAVVPDLYAPNGVGRYLASVDTGVDVLLEDVERIEQRCQGSVKYVFTGYSQGAWVVHRALWQLSRTTTVTDRTVGVVLFADPEFVPHQPIVRENMLSLVGSGAAAIFDRANTDVPEAVRKVTASYCIQDDPVCQTPSVVGAALCGFKMLLDISVCPHFEYVNVGSPAKAAAFISPHLPTKPTAPLVAPIPAVPGTGSTVTDPSGSAPPSAATGFPYHVYHTCSNGKCGLLLHSGPGYSNYPVTRTLVDGDRLDVVCQSAGQSVSGLDHSSSVVWDRLAQGDWAPDFYVNTPGTNGTFSPPIPRC